MNRELEFYNEVKNWDFSKIKYIEECLNSVYNQNLTEF